MIRFWVRPLTPAHCEALSPHVSEEDRIDLLAADYSPETALEQALSEPGDAWAAGIEEDHILGAFGWTEAGAIWSMWRALTFSERKTLLQAAPRFIRAMVRDAKRPLGNLTYVGNERIIEWLNSTGCFTFLVDRRLTYGNREYVPFVTRPHLLAGTAAHV